MAGKKKGKKKKRPFVKLSNAKRKEMFEVWCDKPTETNVREKCRVHWKTVQRYREIDNWDERLAEIKAKANAKVDKKITNDLAKRIEGYKAIATAGLNRWLKELKKQKDQGRAPELDLGIKAQSMLERLIKFLEGEPDSRPDVPAAPAHSADNEDLRKFLSTLTDKLGNLDAKKLGDAIADRLENK